MIFSQFSSISAGKKIALFAAIGVFLLAPVVLYGFSQKKPPTLEVVDQQPPKPTLAPFPPQGEYVENQLIVMYREGMNIDEIADPERKKELNIFFEEIGVTSQEKLNPEGEGTSLDFYVLTFKEGVDVEVAAQKIYELPEVYTIESNAIFRLYQ